MLTESFIASTLASGRDSISSTLKDVGICVHELQPQAIIRNVYKKSSTRVNCLAVSDTHLFAAQSDKAVIHVYSREKGNQEATIAFPERISSLAFLGASGGILAIGTDGGKLILWEVSSGRQVTSTASHLQAVTSLCIIRNQNFILSGSPDANVHVWSVPALVSFSHSSSVSSNQKPHNAPIRTFSNHRSGITALTSSRATSSANYAISASQDNTCYVWNTDTMQILRSILFPQTPLSFCSDPADRVLYTGYADGSIQKLHFTRTRGPESGFESALKDDTTGPLQLEDKDAWKALSPECGPTQCMDLSFDGMFLVSAHESGKVISWDVVKGRVSKVITDLGQSVTNLQMLKPSGLPCDLSNVRVQTVVKPKLDFASNSDLTGAVPSNYAIQIQLQSMSTDPNHAISKRDDFQDALNSPIFSESVIHDAIVGISGPAESSNLSKAGGSDSSKVKLLEERISRLTECLKEYSDAADQSKARSLARMKQREELGLNKRSAYFAAEANGQNGDEAMKPWEDQERDLEMLSDQEETG